MRKKQRRNEESMDMNEIISRAFRARENAYAPYSTFCVGACIETKDGQLYTGCNIENASYSVTNCAERTALFKAVSDGKTEFVRIVIVGGKKDTETHEYCPPCGVCRQALMEFCNPDTFQIILAKTISEYQIYTLKELLPMGFGPKNLQ